MKTLAFASSPLRIFALGALLALAGRAQAQTDPLPSWNDGAAKRAILDFRPGHDGQGEPEVRPARGANRHL